jgi:hypothetical protein
MGQRMLERVLRARRETGHIQELRRLQLSEAPMEDSIMGLPDGVEVFIANRDLRLKA